MAREARYGILPYWSGTHLSRCCMALISMSVSERGISRIDKLVGFWKDA